MVVFLTDIVLLFKKLFGFPGEVHLDGCTSFYFQYFWNEWSWSFNSSMGSISLFTLHFQEKMGTTSSLYVVKLYLKFFIYYSLCAYYKFYPFFIFSASRILITLVMFVKPLRLDHYITVSKFSRVTFWRIMMWVILSWVVTSMSLVPRKEKYVCYCYKLIFWFWNLWFVRTRKNQLECDALIFRIYLFINTCHGWTGLQCCIDNQ
jgi:hypothetical protein